MIQGIYPVIPTMFTDQNIVDHQATRQVVRFAIDSGAHGIVFPGVASEVNFLSLEERRDLLQSVSEEVANAVPMIGGASADTCDDVIKAGQQVLEHGVGHLMIMAPNGLGHDTQAHQDFFATVSSALPQAEIILQNAPQPIGAGLSASQITQITKSIPAITYTKEETLPSGPVITNLLTNQPPHLKGVLGGGGARYIIDELNRGAVGALPAVELTDLHVAIFEAHKQGDLRRARDLYRNSLPLLVAQMIYRMRLTKYVLMKRGVCDRTHVRAPLPELDDHACQDIDAMLDDLKAANR